MRFVCIFALPGVTGLDSKVSGQSASEVGRSPLKRSAKKEVPTLRTRLLPEIQAAGRRDALPEADLPPEGNIRLWRSGGLSGL